MIGTFVAGFKAGSSPRGRGKPVIASGPGTDWGLIPAWAGKTSPGPSRWSVRAAHPRVGGENDLMILSRRRNQGSSPRGRGKPVLRKLARILPRLIPAWAGKTRWRGWKSNPARAHPRVGGENASQVRIICVGAGSSPRGRGKPPYSTVASVRLRLIPAWAGKTLSPRRRGRARAAHPRVGGEN